MEFPSVGLMFSPEYYCIRCCHPEASFLYRVRNKWPNLIQILISTYMLNLILGNPQAKEWLQNNIYLHQPFGNWGGGGGGLGLGFS